MTHLGAVWRENVVGRVYVVPQVTAVGIKPAGRQAGSAALSVLGSSEMVHGWQLAQRQSCHRCDCGLQNSMWCLNPVTHQ